MSTTQLEVNDLMVLVNGINLALNKGFYSKEEVEKIYPCVCKIIDLVMKTNRENFLSNYKQGEPPTENTTLA